MPANLAEWKMQYRMVFGREPTYADLIQEVTINGTHHLMTEYQAQQAAAIAPPLPPPKPLLQQAQELENSGLWREAANLRYQQQAIHNQVVVAQAIPEMNMKAALASGNTVEAARQEQILKEMEYSVRTGTADQIIQKPEVSKAVSQMNQYQAEAEEAGKQRKNEARKARKYGLFGPSWKSNGERRKETMLEQGTRHHPIVGGLVSNIVVPAIGMTIGGPVGAITVSTTYGAVEHGAKGIPSGAIKGAIYVALASAAGEALGVNPEGFGGTITGLNGPSLLNQLGIASAPAIGGGIGLFGNLGQLGLAEQMLAPTMQTASSTTATMLDASTTTTQSINLSLTAAETLSSLAPVIGYYYANQITEPRATSIHQSEQRKKRRKEFYKSIVGMGFGAFVASISAPFLLAGQSSFVIALGEGAIFGGIASGISNKNASQGAFEGAFFAGLGHVIDNGLSYSEYLSESKRLKEALGTAVSSTVYIVVHEGKLEDVLVGAGSSALSNFLVPSVTGSVNEETLRVFATGTVTSLMHRTELAQSLVAAGLGSVQARIQRLAREYGNNIVMSQQTRRRPKPITNDKPEKHKTIEDRKNSSNVERKIEELVFQEAKLQLPGVNEITLRQIVREQMHNYPNARARREFIESLPAEFNLRAYEYLASQNPSGYQKVALPFAVGAYEIALFITGLAYVGVNCCKDWIKNNPGFQAEKDFDESVYEEPDLSLEEKLTKTINGYQPGSTHGANIGNTTPRFLPMFNGQKNLIMEKNKHKSKGNENRPNAPDPDKKYKIAPKGSLPGFDGSIKVKGQTPDGSGKPRDRWLWGDKILEWDKQHGEVEMYDQNGKKHLGAYDPDTSTQLKPPVPGRNIKKYVN